METTDVGRVPPPSDILAIGHQVTLSLAHRLAGRHRAAVRRAVALAERHIRAAHPGAELHVSVYDARNLAQSIISRDEERTGFAAGHAISWLGGTHLVEGVVVVTWDGRVLIRWTGIAAPDTPTPGHE